MRRIEYCVMCILFLFPHSRCMACSLSGTQWRNPAWLVGRHSKRLPYYCCIFLSTNNTLVWDALDLFSRPNRSLTSLDKFDKSQWPFLHPEQLFLLEHWIGQPLSLPPCKVQHSPLCIASFFSKSFKHQDTLKCNV